MPSKYPILKPEEINRRMKKKGFSLVSQKGSHAKFSDGMHTYIIPMHDVVQKGTLKSILKQAHVDLDEFNRLE